MLDGWSWGSSLRAASGVGRVPVCFLLPFPLPFPGAGLALEEIGVWDVAAVVLAGVSDSEF